MQSSDFAGVYKEIAELFDVEIVEKIYENFRGQQIVFPQRLYSHEYIKKSVSKKYTDGESIRELAKKYGYSERWIRKLING